MKYIASCSFGKDSLAMVLMLIEKQYPLDEVVFYDTGKEFQAIYNLRDKLIPILHAHGIKFNQLEPGRKFDYCMFNVPMKSGQIGWGWCGGANRWGTGEKLRSLEKYQKNKIAYVGIAADESIRLEKERKQNVITPLADWQMTESDCLDYCYSKGFDWDENGVELYSVLDRVSCWCCRNKNLKELKGIYLHLPEYWQKLKDIQTLLPQPMKGEGKSVFDLEKRFEDEERQMRLGA